MTHSKHVIIQATTYTFVFCTLFYCFYNLIPAAEGDFRSHIQFAKDALFNDAPMPKHFLYSVLIISTAWWTTNELTWLLSACFWLSTLTILKLATTQFVITRLWNPDAHSQKSLKPLWLSICLLIVFPFPIPEAVEFGSTTLVNLDLKHSLPGLDHIIRGYWYRHNFPPNTWHNSTLVALMPFAIITVYLGYKLLQKPHNTQIALLHFFTTFSAFAKPSFLVAWIPVYFFVSFYSVKDWKQRVISWGPLLLSGLVVVAQYILLYEVPIEGQENSGVNFSWLAVWSSSAGRTESGFYLSVLFSCIMPLSFYLLNPHFLKKDLHLLAIGMSFLSFFYAAFLVEPVRLTDGNFLWSAISSQYILYMVSVSEVFKSTNTTNIAGNLSHKQVIPAMLFLCQVLFGIMYLFRYVALGYYH